MRASWKAVALMGLVAWTCLGLGVLLGKRATHLLPLTLAPLKVQVAEPVRVELYVAADDRLLTALTDSQMTLTVRPLPLPVELAWPTLAVKVEEPPKRKAWWE